jgi:membrane protein required for colicin V production
MAIIDIFIILPLLWGGYMGYHKGLIIEVSSMIALGAGIYLGLKFSDLVSEWINSTMSEPSPYVNLIAFSIVFIAVIVLVFFFAKILERGINLAMLSPINKILGIFFGTGKMILLTGVLLLIMEGYSEQSNKFIHEQKEDSLLYEPFTNLAKGIIPAFYGSELLMNEEVQENGDKEDKKSIDSPK